MIGQVRGEECQTRSPIWCSATFQPTPPCLLSKFDEDLRRVEEHDEFPRIVIMLATSRPCIWAMELEVGLLTKTLGL